MLTQASFVLLRDLVRHIDGASDGQIHPSNPNAQDSEGKVMRRRQVHAYQHIDRETTESNEDPSKHDILFSVQTLISGWVG